MDKQFLWIEFALILNPEKPGISGANSCFFEKFNQYEEKFRAIIIEISECYRQKIILNMTPTSYLV